MLSQSDVVGFLRKNPEQHVAFQILSAYIFSKSSRGNLPSETLAKILTISHKLAVINGPTAAGSPVARALEAAKTALVVANRHWISQGPRALGPLGEIGSASSPDAVAAWTKATDGKVKNFDDGTRSSLSGQAIDAGRVIGPRHRLATDLEAPPMYEPAAQVDQPNAEQVVDDGARAIATEPTEGVREAVQEAVAGPVEREPRSAEVDLEQGRANLARLRQALLEKQQQQADDGVDVPASQRAVDHDDDDDDDDPPPPPIGAPREG